MAEAAPAQKERQNIYGRYGISDAPDTADSVRVRFMCAERKPVDIYVREVLLPGVSGVFSVLAGHTPMLSALRPGAIEMHNSRDEKDFFAVDGGFAVVENNTLTIMCETWEHAKEIDIKRAKGAHERAEARLRKITDETDVARAVVALDRALARIHAHGRVSY